MDTYLTPRSIRKIKVGAYLGLRFSQIRGSSDPPKTETEFPENFGLHLDELSQFSAITTKTLTIPGELDIKTEKRQFSKNQNSQNCRFSVLIPDPPGIVTVWVVIALN